ncbi:MAG: tRNA (N(6)-L-threonylcarbamoyladenosine(37)-C(2))-methylthiotransferase MtaB [Patescibacteria group bacterium]|nr:tRNA (N(6)-L-threonylcarbamoyladenosine(37)-C(2))-methylthiotransferase MtaB [Patescibacteria group bacterium]
MNGKRKKFVIRTLGCKVNQIDSRALKGMLIRSGLIENVNSPDIVIINTCAVTKNAIKKDRKMFNGLKKKHLEAKFVLMGCFPQTYKKDAEKFDVDLVWGTVNLDELVEKIKVLLDISINVSASVGTLVDSPKTGKRSRYFLKIQDGCEQFCSYCNIPYARGNLWSRPEKEIFEEIAMAIKVGFSEIVLCGIHLGLYGKEKGAKTTDLAGLLREIVLIKGLGRVRLSSIEANDISDELLLLIKNSKKICDHLHIPLQSGTDKILEAMNRPYNTSYFEGVVLKARKLIPDISITTDVIVGFPGETKRNFCETLKFIEKMAFSKLHVFPFSAHEKTPASKMKNKVSSEEKAFRASKLRIFGESFEKKYEEKFLGKKIELIVEKNDKGILMGKEEHYFDVIIENKKSEKNAIGTMHKCFID